MDLRPYQLEAGQAIIKSIYEKRGLTFTVEIARQGGKNELSSHLELWLLFHFLDQSQNLIKCSPTFKPQTIVSMMRLKEKLSMAGWDGLWTTEMGYIIRLGDARAIFLSAQDSSNVVGNTAHLLLEVDEAQDVSEDKFVKEFKPMGSTTNVTNVLYGTTWDSTTLLEKMKQNNLELQRKDGIQRHFRYDWQEVAKYNPDYLTYVEGERARLGENHPLFLTQYRLLPISGGGGFLNSTQKTQLQGEHQRLSHPPERIVIKSSSPIPETGNCKLSTVNSPSPTYIAGIDLAGESETLEDDFLKSLKPKRDSTVITIAELEYPSSPFPDPSSSSLTSSRPLRERLQRGGLIPSLETENPDLSFPRMRESKSDSNAIYPSQNTFHSQLLSPNSPLPLINIVQHYHWTGIRHTDLYPQMLDLLKNIWHCRRVVVDATGIGEPVAAFLKGALGSRIIPFKFTTHSKTELGFNLLAAINSGNLKMYMADNSPEYKEFWFQIDHSKSHYRANQTMNFYVDPSVGHDDFLMSLALVAAASQDYHPRQAHGR